MTQRESWAPVGRRVQEVEQVAPVTVTKHVLRMIRPFKIGPGWAYISGLTWLLKRALY